MKKTYLAPSIKVVEFSVERGFEGSNGLMKFNATTNKVDMAWNASQAAADGTNAAHQTQEFINGGNIW